ncbi:MAG: phosphate ABC transporter substrate-binding protein [Tolypothrix carrinoi HA7290-LM1]|jgi:phosphate transport system substrate-binding protein|nr:phosphate ABC transporter substrate-binding protein [Tolypothrix carrinoi HA7290-LM1]
MKKTSSPPPIVFILLSLLLLGGTWWYFHLPRKQLFSTDNQISSVEDINNNKYSFQLPDAVPVGTNVRIDGSTSMVNINEKLKKGFEDKYPGTKVVTNAHSSERGIQDLIAGNIDVAAVSRHLTDDDQKKGLQAVIISNDAIAIVVHKIDNPFKGGLTGTQIADIFRGKIINWSQVGGSSDPIRVINRPVESGTRQTFKELVLGNADFGTASNFTTLPRDTTTGLIQELKKNGIGYATYKQAARESTARIVAIDNSLPGASNYPYRRQLFYVYKNPPNPAVQAFLGYATSKQVKEAL